MASTIYTGTTSQTTAYAATDIYTLAIPTSSITNISQQGANVVIQTGATAFTITGVTLAQLATANFALQGGGVVTFGDGTSDTIADQFSNTIAPTGNNANILMGLGGGDTITVGNGANLIFGGSAQTDTVDGSDSITSGTGNDTIYGNAGNDTIVSGGGADFVFGGIGTDSITAGALTGTASVYGGGGFTDTVDGADVIDITSSTGTLFVTGNAGNDSITAAGLNGSSSIYGGVGADTIAATVVGGTHLFVGGSSAGNTDVDTITVTATASANATIFGGVGITDANDGNDSITAAGFTAGSSLFVYGNAGNDTISVGTAGNASVYGGVGADSITLTAGATAARVQIFAGPNATGNDVVNASAFLGNATIYGGTGLNDSADGADSLAGGFGSDLIYGNGGADTILSGAGNDTLFGGAGNDLFVVNGANNTTVSDFGTGSDTLLLNTSAVLGTDLGAVTSVSASSSAVQITTANGIVNVVGTLPSTLTATLSADNIVDAGDGQLIVATTSTGASLIGTGNNDYLQGNTGTDNLVGGVGNDTLVGGAGSDSLSGGAGSDVFRYSAGLADSSVTATSIAGADRVIDFNFGTNAIGGRVDTFDFTETVGSVVATASGTVTAATFQTDVAALTGFTAAGGIEAQIITANAGDLSGRSFLIVDLNDDGVFTAAADRVVEVTGFTGTIDASDFI